MKQNILITFLPFKVIVFQPKQRHSTGRYFEFKTKKFFNEKYCSEVEYNDIHVIIMLNLECIIFRHRVYIVIIVMNCFL